ncbi:MAG TPA: sigma-70 family RNA polymerase sigma factor [Oscillospiraceae bacterium]|nr:sigma-70 family RNA polymerase sigma factor [Oscillospiraceae bacterium]HPF55007.1 sigma-70 family RNA polymerase sigma factor [Clostridiales bacterium]HPK35925.1 sigma-70 family RNA polymerase sigma factor [Oscillospiraceae bacterium]HPR75619.1 sigma-70 family RNA polymerase sigma factor [Oscillospiraceae bacterium]
MLAILLTFIDDDEDRTFFTQLYQNNEKLLFIIANGILHSQAKAEEAVQDTYVKAIEHLAQLKGKSSEEQKAWLIVVVKHVSVNFMKREKKIEYFDFGENKFERYTIDFSGEINYNRLKQLIRELPDAYQNILYLRFVCEWSYSEIAAELGINVNLVGTRVLRGREILIQKLKQEEIKK